MKNVKKIELTTPETNEVRVRFALAVAIMKKKKEIEYMESEILRAARVGRIDKIKDLSEQYKREFDELHNNSKLAQSVLI